MLNRQPEKAPRQLAALAQSTAANTEGSNNVYGAQQAVVTGSIPTPTSSAAPVVTAFVAFTPRFSGKGSIHASLVSAPNQNGGTQALRGSIQFTTTAPTVGSAPVTPTVVAAGIDDDVGTGQSAAIPFTSSITGLTVGTTYYLCLCVAQSAAGAFALGASAGNGIRVAETPNG